MSQSGGKKQEEKKLAKEKDSQKKIEAEIAAEVKKSTKGSVKFVFGYGRRECCSVILGIIFMIIASGAELIMPLFIGAAIDMLDEKDHDGVARLCGYMLIALAVSKSKSVCLTHSYFLVYRFAASPYSCAQLYSTF